MRVSAVESTTLVTVSYDDARELLQLEFCSRAVYQYFSVPLRYINRCWMLHPRGVISTRLSGATSRIV